MRHQRREAFFSHCGRVYQKGEQEYVGWRGARDYAHVRYNRLQSIAEDAQFVSQVAETYPQYPLVGNERCGTWYCDPEKVRSVSKESRLILGLSERLLQIY